MFNLNPEDIYSHIRKQGEKELNNQFRDCNRELVHAEAGIGKQDMTMQKLYGDNVEGNINERCVRISASCETVQKLQEVRKAEQESRSQRKDD